MDPYRRNMEPIYPVNTPGVSTASGFRRDNWMPSHYYPATFTTLIGFHPKMERNEDFILCVHVSINETRPVGRLPFPGQRFYNAFAVSTRVYIDTGEIVPDMSPFVNSWATRAYEIGLGHGAFPKGTYIIINGKCVGNSPATVHIEYSWVDKGTHYGVRGDVNNISGFTPDGTNGIRERKFFTALDSIATSHTHPWGQPDHLWHDLVRRMTAKDPPIKHMWNANQQILYLSGTEEERAHRGDRHTTATSS
ncbi:hypothetical protein F4859DRAFT_529937 [Xylaria cf. heliscus]|nr:hypothetical protein F4859DRAFT_529937 [Xylaria cf. heliscus]